MDLLLILLAVIGFLPLLLDHYQDVENKRAERLYGRHDAVEDHLLKAEVGTKVESVIVRTPEDDERARLRAEAVRLPYDTDPALRAQFEFDAIDGIEYSLRTEKT
jgi:hypothetical protein